MSADLDQAIYALLTPTHAVIDHHAKDDGSTCRKCGTCWPCFEMDTAIAALDLVLRVHIAARNAHAAPVPGAVKVAVNEV